MVKPSPSNAVGHLAALALLSTALLAGCADGAGEGLGEDLAGVDSMSGGDLARGDGGSGSAALSCDEAHPAHTVGLLRCTPKASPGYTLLVPTFYTDAYLLDLRGQVVHTWHSRYASGQMAYLLPDGRLLRAARSEVQPGIDVGGIGGRVEILGWDSEVLWDFPYCVAGSHCQHHDVQALPNGNVLLLAWERHSRAEMEQAGLNVALWGDTADFWVDTVVEVKPTGLHSGEVVWKWRIFDHYIQDHDPQKDHYGPVAEHPERLDVNVLPMPMLKNDLSHFNALDYNAELDQIALSYNLMSEILIIDHGTTAAEARGHSGGRYGVGGDILYRWGNPSSYRAGGAEDQRLFSQHDISWIAPDLPGAGNLLVFSNGLGRSGAGGANLSTVEEFSTPLEPGGAYRPGRGGAYGPARAAWTYAPSDPTLITTIAGGSAQRLPNGNTLVTNSVSGHVLEVTPRGEIVWHYASPVTAQGRQPQGAQFPQLSVAYSPIVRITRRYPRSFPGLRGRTLAAQGPLELAAERP